MNKNKLIVFALTLPLISSCSLIDKIKSLFDKRPDTLEIPSLNIDEININVPDKPTHRNTAPKEDGDNVIFDFYEISDLHGAVNENGNNLGLAKLSSYIDIKRESNEGGTFLLSGGDMFQGSAESNLTKGQIVSYAMDYIGFDSMSVGNHEFDWSTEYIKKNNALTSFPFLAANLRNKADNTIPDFVKSSITYQAGSYKIGIIGTIGYGIEGSISTKMLDGYKFISEYEAVKQEATNLRNDGCDIVVWSSHNDIEEFTVSGIPHDYGVDAAFGAHSHEAKTATCENIPFAMTSSYGKSIAHISLAMNKNTKKVVSFTNEVDENPAALVGGKKDNYVQSLIDQYAPYIDPIKKIEVGELDSDFDVATLGRYTVKSMYDNYKDDLYSVSAVFHNVNGGIRSAIKKGKVTYGDIYTSFPFENELILLKVSGGKLRSYISNITTTNLAVYHTFKLQSDIDTNKDYYIMTTDYLATSSNAPFKLKDSDMIHTNLFVRDCVAQSMYKEKKTEINNYKSYLTQFSVLY